MFYSLSLISFNFHLKLLGDIVSASLLTTKNLKVFIFLYIFVNQLKQQKWKHDQYILFSRYKVLHLGNIIEVPTMNSKAAGSLIDS